MRLLVVGGSGFIGSRFCARIQKSDHAFEILDKNPSSSFIEHVTIADVRFPIAISSAADVIINLAAEHRDDVYPLSLYNETNVNGAINICELARQIKINKIIFTSSVAVYGFAPLGTNESGKIMPFNEYGRTKWEAEKVYKKWQAEDSKNRTLVIVRPTVVFGERNRGNVFNLLKQIASGKFVMVGNGLNRKSMAYVENVAAFLEYSMSFKPGVHIYNYIDKPDFSMNYLVCYVNKLLGKSSEIRMRLPYIIGLFVGKVFDLGAKLSSRKFSISAIRVKKFCADSVYESAISDTGFVPPINLIDAIEKTVSYEFIEDHHNEQVFFTE
jgi:nucleoside-diphosphate-sugar epimerase